MPFSGNGAEQRSRTIFLFDFFFGAENRYRPKQEYTNHK